MFVAVVAVGSTACAPDPPKGSSSPAVKEDTKSATKTPDPPNKPKPPAPGDVGQVQAEPPISPTSPKLSGMDPTSTTASGAGAAQIDITLTGNQFAPDAVIGFGDQSLKPLSATSTEIKVRVPAVLLGNAATLPVKVLNPPAKGGTSNTLSFTVTSANVVLNLSGINPSSAEQGGAGQIALEVTGSGFTQSSRVRFNGLDLRTSFRGASALQAVLPSTMLQLAGTVSITVFDPQGNAVSAPRSFAVRAKPAAASTSTASPTSPGAASTCKFNCADFGYASGQCFQDFTCKNGCLVEGKCPAAAAPSCKYRCSSYDYVAGQCVGDWACRDDGCLVPKTCGDATSASANGGTGTSTCEYACNDPSGAWSYSAGECKDNYECGSDNCLHTKVCATTATATAAAACEYPCNDPNGAWSYSTGQCSAGYECEADGCLQAKVCSGTASQTASCEYACVDPAGAWSYSPGECTAGYACQSDGCLHQQVCTSAVDSTPTVSSVGGSSCTYPCVDPDCAYSYAENECSAGYCCFSGCLIASTATFEL
jgi:hypothetical protein